MCDCLALVPCLLKGVSWLTSTCCDDTMAACLAKAAVPTSQLATRQQDSLQARVPKEWKVPQNQHVETPMETPVLCRGGPCCKCYSMIWMRWAHGTARKTSRSRYRMTSLPAVFLAAFRCQQHNLLSSLWNLTWYDRIHFSKKKLYEQLLLKHIFWAQGFRSWSMA